MYVPPALFGLDLQTGDWLVEEKGEGVVIRVPDSPEIFWIRVVFHVSEVLQTFSIISVSVDEIVFVDLQSKSEYFEQWKKDLVVDVLLSVNEP